MGRHWMRILALLVLTGSAFAAAMASQHYGLGAFLLIAGGFGFGSYALGMAHVRGRSDDRPEGERQRQHPL